MSEKQTYASDAADKVLVRMPDGMRDRIKDAAKHNNRTMNAEIVARLQASFAPGGHGHLVIRMNATGADDRIGKTLEQLPADLSSQYGLHLYNTELKAAQSQLEEAREEFQPLYDKLQRLLKKEDGPEGPKMRASEAVEATRRRISELTNQVEALNQTISNIHLYRKVEGLPELRNVREVSVSVRVS